MEVVHSSAKISGVKQHFLALNVRGWLIALWLKLAGWNSNSSNM